MKASISHLNHQLGIEFEFSCEYNPQQEVVDDATLMQQVVSNQLVNHMDQDRQKYTGFFSSGLSNHSKVSFVWEIVSISHEDIEI